MVDLPDGYVLPGARATVLLVTLIPFDSVARVFVEGTFLTDPVELHRAGS